MKISYLGDRGYYIKSHTLPDGFINIGDNRELGFDNNSAYYGVAFLNTEKNISYC